LIDICGVDIMAENLTQPLKDNGGVILEVNAAPGFRMHLPLLKVYQEMSQLLLLICFILREKPNSDYRSNWY
jgi:D-alanine-D-alanine ligase-like ATP-grasp enzyme